jgi:cytochrome c oxidase assembly protein subunit 11
VARVAEPEANAGASAGANQRQQNKVLTRKLWWFVAGAFAFGWALVPLYDVLCSVTGYGSKKELLVAAQPSRTVDLNRLVTVEFVSTMPTTGAWDFGPEQGELKHCAEYGHPVFSQDRLFLFHAAAVCGQSATRTESTFFC